MILKSIKDCCKIIVGIPLHSFTSSFHTSIQSRPHEAQYQDAVKKDLNKFFYKIDLS